MNQPINHVEYRKDLFSDERDDTLAEVGQPTIRQDILGHVTGRSPYYDDHLFDGLLHIRCVRSPHHHARIRSVDSSAAERLPVLNEIGIQTVINGPIPVSADGEPPRCNVTSPEDAGRAWGGSEKAGGAVVEGGALALDDGVGDVAVKGHGAVHHAGRGQLDDAVAEATRLLGNRAEFGVFKPSWRANVKPKNLPSTEAVNGLLMI